METIGQRIKKRREKLGFSADKLAEMIGKDRITIYRYESGHIQNMPVSIVAPLANALQTTPAYLMGWTEEASIGDIKPIGKQKLPVLGEIACGQPIMANEEREFYITVGVNIKADFVLVARGDSMTGARIFDGDLVFIRKQAAVNNGEIAAVIIDDVATLKRVFYNPNNQKLVLQAENAKYPPLVYVGTELNDVHILGKAVAFQSDVK